MTERLGNAFLYVCVHDRGVGLMHSSECVRDRGVG